jgi:ethanolamine permease
VVATFLVDSVAALWTLGAFLLFMAYFGLYSRHHLVAAAPDEEFAALAAAETELK